MTIIKHLYTLNKKALPTICRSLHMHDIPIAQAQVRFKTASNHCSFQWFNFLLDNPV